MGRIKIHCDNCGTFWEVFPRDVNEPHSRQCPNCLREINPQTWERFIVPAFGMLDDANRELAKDVSGYGNTLFNISYSDY